MSDSEDDDMSMTGSEGEDVDMEDEEAEEGVGGADEEVQASDGDELDADVENGSDSGAGWFQKEIWQHKKLPYYPELEQQANRNFGNIKAGLAHAILLNDPQIGLLHWTLELEKYIDQYGRRFSKEDHILIVKLLLSQIKKGVLFRDVKCAIHCLNAYLNKRDFLLRGDIVIDWRPLYDLYVEVAYKNLEEDGVFLLPDGFKNELHNLIFYSRSYFHDGVVQELLDELRPWMCPWDESMVRAWKLLDLFTPMNFTPELQKTHGAGLWLDEALHWFEVVENNSLIDTYILKMCARLSYECPGYIDWTDKLDLIFTKLIRSLRLGVLVGLCQSFSMDTGALLLTYMINTECHEKLMEHLRAVFKMVESFVHPSNHGSHTQYVLGLMQKLSHNVIVRVKRERSEKPTKPRTLNRIPSSMKLSQKHLDELVSMMLNCIKLAIFTKSHQELVTPMVKNVCSLSPKLVLPAILDVVYPALETLTEPHRLLQALQVLVAVSPILAKDDTYRIHVITLLNSLLPGLDKNDIAKCMVTFQFVGIMVNLIPLADCSEAVYLRSDLTDEEKELCSATANFEDIITMFMDKLLTMLIDTGETASSSGIHGTISAKGKGNIEDSILHRGTISVFKGIFRNSSTALFKVAMDRVYNFLSEHVFDSKVVCDSVSDMVFVIVKFNAELAFPRFYKLIYRRLSECLTPEVFQEEKPDLQVMWWLTMAARLVKLPAHVVTANWQDIRALLDLVAPFIKFNDATDRSQMLIENIMESLCTIYVLDTCRNRALLDKPLDEHLPIRHWCAPIEKKTWEVKWHVPSQEDIDRATELMTAFVVPNVQALSSPEGLDKKEILVRLQRIRHAISGAGMSLPLFEGPCIPLTESPTFHTTEHYVCKPADTPEISLNGVHVRQMLFECLKNLLSYICQHSEDDVKSIHEIIVILNGLENFRGINKESYNQSAQNYRVTKLILCDRISGNKGNIEMLNEDYVLLQHKKRMCSMCGYQFRQQSLDIVRMLIKLATSYYAQTRIKSQQVLLNMLKDHPYSYKIVLPEILAYLDPANNSTHEQIKGALHLLVEGKRMAIVMRASFETQLASWSSIISSKHSEKPSIIHLLERAQNTIVDGYESYRTEFEITDEQRAIARQFLDVKEACPVNPTRDAPSEDLIAANADNLQKLSEHWKAGYYRLAERLLELSSSPTLHWKQVDMAQAMLSLLVRRDMQYPDAALRCVMRLIVHDSIKTRRMATAVVASWLRMNKPKAVKKEVVINKPDNVSPGAKWPIPYGLREDNRCMFFEEEKLPTTDEEWDKFQFCGKQHWGFYTWPKQLITYAPLGEQTAIDREESQLTELEKFVLDTLRDPEYSLRLRTLFAVEEKKGEETFNAVNFSFFQGLARCFNDMICGVFKEHLDVLIPSTKDSHQRLAAELVAALINGSKLWKHHRQMKMWEWLGPLLVRALETVQDDNMRNWGVCLATVCGSSEARMLKPLLDILAQCISKPCDSSYIASARLFLVQGSLCQFEWRGMELWNKMVETLRPTLVQQYANLRDRIAICLVSASWYDLPSIVRSPQLPPALLPPTVDDVFTSYNELLTACWEETKLCTVDNSEVHAAESEVKKQSRLALKSVISFTYNQSLQAFISTYPSIIRLLPLFCHFNNDCGDEELQKSCGSLLRDLMQAMYVTKDHAPLFVAVFEQVLKAQCWWRSKVALLTVLRTMVFANTCSFNPYREQIGKLLISSLADPQIEVREAAATAVSTLIKVGFFEVTNEIVETFSSALHSTDPLHRHGGVLGLSAVVLAYPYTVPTFLPDVLMRLCRMATQANPIKDTVKRTLSEFKRTHLDSWREHESQFNEDQLCVLRDLLISPNYYV